MQSIHMAKAKGCLSKLFQNKYNLPPLVDAIDWTTTDEAAMRMQGPIHFILPSNGRSRSRMIKHMEPNVVRYLYFLRFSLSSLCHPRPRSPT